MLGLLILLVSTFLMIYLQRRIWKVCKNIVFPIMTGIFYYWSIAGAWLFIFDQLTGFGKNIGLSYYYLLEKMFTVKLDMDYYLSLSLYASFILIFQFIVLIGLNWIQRKNGEKQIKEQIELKSWPFVIMVLVSVVFSFYFVKDTFIYSILLEESVYINIRSSGIPFYSIHQYFNLVIELALFIPIGVRLNKGVHLPVKINKLGWFFWFAFAVGNAYLIMIGSRHELFSAALIGLMLMSFPHRSIRKSFWVYCIYTGGVLVLLMLNDPVRALMPKIGKSIGLDTLFGNRENYYKAKLYKYDRSFVAHKDSVTTKKMLSDWSNRDTLIFLNEEPLTMNKLEFVKQRADHPTYLTINGKKLKMIDEHSSTAYSGRGLVKKVISAATVLLFSNELFAGHFSMYGVLHNNLKPNYGIEARAFVQSLVPGIVRSESKDNAYSYYVKELKLNTNQGYTLNNVTGWYISFSYFGIVLGSIFTAVLILILFNIHFKTSHQLWKFLSLLALIGVTATSTILVRSGPSALKAVLYEGILLPAILVLFALLSVKITAFFVKKRA